MIYYDWDKDVLEIKNDNDNDNDNVNKKYLISGLL